MLEFRKLDAYRYAVALLGLVAGLVDRVPRPQRGLADQLGRAALVVLRTLAEGHHRQRGDRPEARHCYAFARGATFECVGLVDTLETMRAIPGEDAARAREILSRLLAMLTRLEGESRGDLDPLCRAALAGPLAPEDAMPATE
jgi:four helix bundle protein